MSRHSSVSSACFLRSPPLPLQKRPRTNRCPNFSCTALPSHLFRAAIAGATAALLLSPVSDATAKGLLSTNTIFRRYLVTDSDAILRYSFPIPSESYSNDQIPIRRVQELLERLGVDLRARGAAGIIAGRRDMQKLTDLLSKGRLDILLDVPGKKRQVAAEWLSSLELCLQQIESELGTSTATVSSSVFPPQLGKLTDTISDILESRKSAINRADLDVSLVEESRQKALQYVYFIEELAVEGIGLPYKIPRRYSSFPRLIGRATVELRLKKGGDGIWVDPATRNPVGKEVSMTATLDGFSAPLTAGNFIDVARSGYYDNTRVLASQKGFFAQLGEREDDNLDGFKDPKTGQRRQIPLEILADGEPSPSYGGTLDELGIGDLQPVLPVSAYGAMAMVHSVENANDASSQFYFFTLDPTSYQARSFGGSVLTGSISTFGYVGGGKQYLSQIQAGDKLVSVKMISGLQNFLERGDG